MTEQIRRGSVRRRRNKASFASCWAGFEKLKQAALHQGEHRESDENGRLSGATFTQNVRKFLSENGEVPMMQGAYDEMTSDERSVFLRGLDTLQTFIGSARAALCGLEGEATIR